MAWIQLETIEVAERIPGVEISSPIETYTRLERFAIDFKKRSLEIRFAKYASEEAFEDGLDPIENIHVAFGARRRAPTKTHPRIPSFDEVMSDPVTAGAIHTLQRQSYEFSGKLLSFANAAADDRVPLANDAPKRRTDRGRGGRR